MALGRRCEAGCETWPATDFFQTCPCCGQAADIWRDVEPIGKVEAMRLAFDLFYAEWDEERSEGRLSPDAPDARGPFAAPISA